jgi:hypothetical protein
MTQIQKLSKGATDVFEENGSTKVRFHSTVVVAFDSENVILNSGGWRTVTTKLRMNQASNQFNLGFRVYQEKREWLVDCGHAQKMEFCDGMVIPR